MNLTAWIHAEHAKLDAFTEWWVRSWATNPTQFPLEMGEADWEEQFLCWKEAADTEPDPPGGFGGPSGEPEGWDNSTGKE